MPMSCTCLHFDINMSELWRMEVLTRMEVLRYKSKLQYGLSAVVFCVSGLYHLKTSAGWSSAGSVTAPPPLSKCNSCYAAIRSILCTSHHLQRMQRWALMPPVPR